MKTMAQAEGAEGAEDASSGTRQRLLDAAWAIVLDEGLRSATSRRITERADANLGAITYYFGSKDALLAEAAVARMELWTQPLAGALLGDERDGGNRTDVVIASLLGFLQDLPDAPGLFEVMFARDGSDDVRAMMQTHLSGFQRTVAGLMTRQRRRGELPASVQPKAMAGVFTAFALGLMAQEVIGANPASIAAMVGQLLALLAAGAASAGGGDSS
jgi:AcrR family transcriptional regulator